MSGPLEEKVANVLTATPFASIAGVNFMTLNELLETGTLIVGFVAGMFAMFFHIRRYFRSRARGKKQ